MQGKAAKARQAKPLTLERYHGFFLDPWDAPVTIDHLNHILTMHGFIKFHHECKWWIMDRLVGEVDLQPPRRSTLHGAALSAAAAAHPSAAVITAEQARADVEAIGWVECPIGCVTALAAPAGEGGAPEPVEPVPRPADFVLAGRRPRSKRTRRSAYRLREAAAPKVKVGAHDKKVKEEVEKPEPELRAPPSPPPRWMRSPTPPPPASPPPPLPPRDQPTLAPIPAPPLWGLPTLPSHNSELFWGLPLHRVAGPPPGWSPPTVPPSYPAPFWGAPSALPPLPPHVLSGWPHTPPPPPPTWAGIWSPTAMLHMHLQQSPPPVLPPYPPPHLQGLGQQLRQPPPTGVSWGRPVW